MASTLLGRCLCSFLHCILESRGTATTSGEEFKQKDYIWCSRVHESICVVGRGGVGGERTSSAIWRYHSCCQADRSQRRMCSVLFGSSVSTSRFVRRSMNGRSTCTAVPPRPCQSILGVDTAKRHMGGLKVSDIATTQRGLLWCHHHHERHDPSKSCFF
jgi:hypothetical protein